MEITKTKYFIALHYSYLMQGINVISVAKLLFYSGIGISVMQTNLFSAIMWSILYGVSCYCLGWLWYRKEMPEATTEVANVRNKFVEQMRRLNKW